MSGKPDKTEQAVRRRRVFYIPGYDPINPRRYRELYRKESGAQAAISGYEITLSPKTTKGPYGWHVSAIVDGQETQTDVEALVWSDIVRDSMSHTIPATYSGCCAQLGPISARARFGGSCGSGRALLLRRFILC